LSREDLGTCEKMSDEARGKAGDVLAAVKRILLACMWVVEGTRI
jgi:hypothetical protein